MKNIFLIIFFILLIFSISFIIFKIKENNIDNWNIQKNINNNIIEKFNDSVDDMCNNAIDLFKKNKNLTDNNDIKKTIIKAVCSQKNSVKGDKKRKQVYKIMKNKQEELNKILKNNN